MQAGILGLVDGDFDDLSSFNRTRQEGAFTLNRAIEVSRTFSGPGSRVGYVGRAAIQRVETQETFDFQSGKIVSSEERTKNTHMTDFLVIPDYIALVSGNAGAFAFDLINEETGADIRRGQIDLWKLLEDHSDSDAWQAGFYGNDGLAQKGTVYGDSVMNDAELKDVLRHSKLNQLGLIVKHDGYDVNLTMAKSGYLQVYTPDLEPDEFSDFFSEHIYNYVSEGN